MKHRNYLIRFFFSSDFPGTKFCLLAASSAYNHKSLFFCTTLTKSLNIPVHECPFFFGGLPAGLGVADMGVGVG